MASIIITSLTPTAGTILSNVPFGQDTTFSVVASADFSTATYAYQWKKGGTSISGAINSSYTFDALASTLGVYTVSVSALSAGVSQAVVNSGNITLSSVAEDTVKPFDVYDRGTESGRERHRRMHHLGYI
jgi:hypothetical protein